MIFFGLGWEPGGCEVGVDLRRRMSRDTIRHLLRAIACFINREKVLDTPQINNGWSHCLANIHRERISYELLPCWGDYFLQRWTHD
jgi:hypothetical protein